VVKTLLTLHDVREAEAYYGSGQWRNDTLYSLAEHWAKERGESIAVTDPWRSLSWSDLLRQADVVAYALDSAGLKAGDRVSVWMGNRAEAVIVFLACSRGGYVFNTSIHPTYTVDDVVGLLSKVETRALFAQPGHGADSDTNSIFDRVNEIETLRAVFAVPLPGEAIEGDIDPFPPVIVGQSSLPEPDPDRIVYLAFTSGTTGAPKGVMHSDNSLLANARAMVSDWDHGGDTVLLTLSQLSHHIGTVALCQALVGGFQLVLTDSKAQIDTIDWIRRTGASYVMGVPTHAIDLLAQIDSGHAQDLGRVSVFYMAGAPIPRETAERLLSLNIKPQNVYGMTENGSHQYTLPSDDTATITGTCGKCCAAYEIELFSQDDPDKSVAQGEIGQIGGRGAMRMLGYFGNQSATEKSFNADGWFLSGDLGRFDESGNLEIVGRIKDVIIRGGHNIFPAQIEDLAMRHPGVLKAAAVAVSDERLGERVCLIIVPAAGANPSGNELVDFLRESGLSKFDVPEFFLAERELPLGPTGKILKRELEQSLRRGDLCPQALRTEVSQS
jgi:acyl-CoA synthetase